MGEKKRKWRREKVKDLLSFRGTVGWRGAVFYLGGDGIGLTPCIQPVPFLEFLFCSFRRRRAQKGPCQGAALGCHTWERRPEELVLGKAGHAAASRLPALGLVEAATLLGLHQFSCLHYFFL